ncbi:MAG: hypothetical protein BGO82_12105 [Devosia sp. 67-54]|uniref:hypothetical protein n=1 Tax=unclassified Devosia TaxID=196773 RepID=UPI000960AE7F|nr:MULTISPECIES: hypothetical protein [unclassified Devosia]MBN9304613.1 hypothetical protein [Devosia sp.]OJX15399.1 MAG: hypothetical protein BGO82_12105 [Devosia sp. 67-54]
MHRRRPYSAWLLALALSTSLCAPLAPAFAATVEALPTAPAAPLAVPGAEAGAFRTWVQLVWNPATRRLERLSFTAWDPIPSLGLELQWLPDDPAGNRAGPLDGRGTLSFRKPGAASYDAAATLAQYRGTLRDGRAEGFGEFLDRSGFSYAGGWHLGLMEGEGRLVAANGDEYVGAFKAGRRDGKGVFTDATGQIFTGRFVNGAEADGVTLQRTAGTYPVYADLRIGVVTERRPHNYDLGFDPMSYTSKADGDALDILPDDQRLLDVWHGAVPITMTDAEIAAFDDPSTTPSFLGAYERFDPLSLVFELENSSTETVSVVGGFLDVGNSRRDGEPAVQVRPFPRDPCSGAVDFLPKFFIDNFGWSAMENASLEITAGSIDGRSEGTPLSVPLPAITTTAEANVAAQMTALGLDTGFLSANKLRCTDPNDERLCLAELRQSGRFGKLADYISLDYSTVVTAVLGSIDYDWTTSDGAVSHKSSPFSVTIPIASVANDAECGEGGEIIPVRHDPFQFHLDQQNYRMSLPFAGDVAPGFTSRWRIELSAAETSLHDFQIVLLLSDGRQLASRPIHLTYFMPPKHDVPK